MSMPPEAIKASPKQTHVARQHKHGASLVSCRFDPTGKFVFYGAMDHGVWRWDLENDSVVKLDGHESWVRAIAFDEERRQVITGGYDGRLIWWTAEGQLEQIRVLSAHEGWIRSIAISPDQQMLASAGNDLTVRLWSCEDGKLIQQFEGHERHVYNVVFQPNGKHLATGDLMGNLYHWNVVAAKLERKFVVSPLHKYDTGFGADIGGFRDLRFNADGSLLGCAGITNVTNAFAGVGNPLVVIWDWDEGKQKTAYESKNKLRGVAWGVVFHPDGFTIGGSGGGGGGYLLFWNADETQEFHQFKLPDTIRDLDMSPDRVQLVTAHHDGHIRISRMTRKA